MESKEEIRTVAVIFAGGIGRRMGADIPKQFLRVNGKPIIAQTIELFEINKSIDGVYVACVADYIADLEQIVGYYGFRKIKKIFPGGETGMDSIYRGLLEVKKDYDEAVVLMHDGVRPLVSQETITKCATDTEQYGSAITATMAFETPVISADGNTIESTVKRDNMYTAQAPQGFRLNQILDFHNQERASENPYEDVVDSCTLALKYGMKPHIIQGNRGNVKVTTTEDYLTLVSNSAMENYREIFELELRTGMEQ